MVKKSNNIEPELLTIKQAAQVLNVSEVSLRRWTNSGHLPCLRIGRRNERRFRRDDLLAFIGDDTVASPVSESAVPAEDSVTGVFIDDLVVPYGNHLCSIYESDQGRLKAAVPFLADGLKAGDLCYFISSPAVRKGILAEVEKIYPKLTDAISEDRLILSDGLDNTPAMVDYFKTQFTQAICQEFKRLRVLGDMSWLTDKGYNLDEVKAFETQYNHELAHHFPVVALCLYDAREFSGQGILAALKCHDDTFKFPASRFLGV